MSRTNRTFVNIFFSLAYFLINVICGLVAPRLILSTYGSEYNGIILSVTQFLSMINILTLGVAGPTRVALYQSIAIKDINLTSEIVKATEIFMRKVAKAIVIYAFLLMIIYPSVVKSSISRAEIAIIIVIISVSTFAQYFFAFTNRTLLGAAQADYIAKIFDIIKVVSNTVLVILLTYYKMPIYVVLMGSSTVFFVVPCFMNFYVKKKYEIISNCIPNNVAIDNRLAATYHSVANIIHDNTDVAILSIISNVMTVSVFNIYNLVMLALRNAMRIFTNVLEAPFGELWAKKEYKILKEAFNIYEFVIYFFASVTFSTTAVLILPFISIYTKAVHDINYILPLFANLMIIAEATYCIRQPYMTLVQATGNYEATKKDALYEVIINICVSLVLAIYIGLYGVVIGTICANLYRTIKYAKFCFGKLLFCKFHKFIIKNIWAICTILSGVIISSYFIEYIDISTDWLAWGKAAIVVLFVNILVSLSSFFVFYRDEFNKIVSFIIKYIGNKRSVVYENQK